MSMIPERNSGTMKMITSGTKIIAIKNGLLCSSSSKLILSILSDTLLKITVPIINAIAIPMNPIIKPSDKGMILKIESLESI